MKKNLSSSKWIFKKVRPYIPNLIIMILTGVSISYLGVRFALMSKNLIDIATKQAEGSVKTAILQLMIMLAIQLVLQIIHVRIHIKTSGKISMDIRTDMFYKLLKKDFAKVSSIHSGEILNTLISDISMVAEKTTQLIPSVFTLVSSILFSFLALYSLDSTFALICLGLGPVALLVAYIYKKKIKSLHKKCRESDGKVRAFLQETIQNFLVVKAFGRENTMRARSRDLQYISYNLTVKRSTLSIFANIMFFLAITVVYYGALAWSVYRLSLGLITFGTVTAVLGLVGQLQTPFRDLSSILPQVYMTLASADRVIELENLDDEEPVHLDENIDLNNFSEIVFEDVNFSYGDVEVLRNVSFSVKKGEFVALCGNSGAGKSTMTKLLLSVLKAQSGEVYLKLDDENKIKFGAETRKMFSYVPQGNMILSGTIRDNITFADENPDEEKVLWASEAAQIKETVENMPNGFDTKLGEKGIGLSEGQIQRIAIARALYYDAPVLLFDEATSSLDIHTEAELLKSIKELTDKTCIIISHRKEVISACDKTYYLQEGTLNNL